MLTLMEAAQQERRDRGNCDRGITARLRTTRASRILHADASAARLLRRDPAALLDKPLVVFIQSRDRAAFRSRLALLPTGGRVEGWALDFATSNGADIPVTAAVEARAALTNGAEDELHWTLIATPPSDADGEGAASDARLAAAESVASECAQLRHELKQPLAAIISYARGAIMRSRNQSLSPADLERVLEIIVVEALRVAERLRRREEESEGE